MDITLIATAAMTILGPYLSKAAGKLAEKVGEDLWSKVKHVFINDAEKELVKKVDEQKISNVELIEIENSLTKHLEEDGDFLTSVTKTLNITPANAYILENSLKVAAQIRDELKPLYTYISKAGVGTTGDIEIRIDQLERKLKQIEGKIIATITN